MPFRTPPKPLPASLAPEHQPPARQPAAHYGYAFAPWSSPPPPVATNARTLGWHAGPCAVCGYAMLAGDRVADLADGRTVHLAGCVTAAATA